VIEGLVGRVLNGTVRVCERVKGASVTVTLDLIVAAFVVVILGRLVCSTSASQIGSSQPKRQIYKNFI
jgi:hypothetical protein